MGNRTQKLQTLYQIGLNYFQDREYERAIECWEGAVFFDPKNAQAFAYMGLAYCAQGKFDEGIQYYEKALDLDPKYAKGWNLLGNAFKERGELFRAVKAYESGLELEPENPDIVYNLAMSCFEVMEYDRAIELLETLLAGPERNEALVYLANAHYRLDDYAKALSYLDQFLAETPGGRQRVRYQTARRLLERFRQEAALESPAAS